MTKTAALKKNNKDGIDVAIAIITSLLVLVFVFACISCGVWIYLKTNPQAGPDTSAVTYTGTIKDENGEERSLLELEYWENKDSLGKEVAEISFNAYTGNDNTTVIQKGVQFMNIDEKDPNIGVSGFLSDLITSIRDKKPLAFFKEVSYDKVHGHSFQTLAKIEPGTKMFITINNESFCFVMNGTYTTYTEQFNPGKSFVNFFRAMVGKASFYERDYWFENIPTVHSYTMNDFYNEVFKALLSSDVGYGTYTSNLVDLAKFFEIKKLNEKGQWESVTVGHDTVKSYFSVKVTKHAEGLRRAKESNFKQYDGNADFTTCPTDNELKDFSSAEVESTLSCREFDYRFNKTYGGYVAQLKPGKQGTSINIDLTDLFFTSDIKLVGILFTSINNYRNIEIKYKTLIPDTFVLFAENRDFLPSFNIVSVKVYGGATSPKLGNCLLGV